MAKREKDKEKEKQNQKLKPTIPIKPIKRNGRIGNRDKYKDWISSAGLTLIEGWARNGLTDAEIALRMGINTSTLYEYKKKYPEIANVLKTNKEYADIQVEQALLKRALGIKVTETQTITSANGSVKTIEIVKEIPGDAIAQIFWLKNRKPDTWREKQEIIQEVEVKPSSANDSILESLSKRKVEE